MSLFDFVYFIVKLAYYWWLVRNKGSRRTREEETNNELRATKKTPLIIPRRAARDFMLRQRLPQTTLTHLHQLRAFFYFPKNNNNNKCAIARRRKQIAHKRARKSHFRPLDSGFAV